MAARLWSTVTAAVPTCASSARSASGRPRWSPAGTPSAPRARGGSWRRAPAPCAASAWPARCACSYRVYVGGQPCFVAIAGLPATRGLGGMAINASLRPRGYRPLDPTPRARGMRPPDPLSDWQILLFEYASCSSDSKRCNLQLCAHRSSTRVSCISWSSRGSCDEFLQFWF